MSRGAGLVYRGSIEEMHGAVVVSMRDCQCRRCLFEPRGLVEVKVRLRGLEDRMEHARRSSFSDV